MKFYMGVHKPKHAGRFPRAFVSVNVLKDRRSDFPVNTWILDSGAFTQVQRFGDFDMTPDQYLRHIDRWSVCGSFECAVSQDYMVEDFILARCGRSVADHQKMTIERYEYLSARAPVMPCLQGQTPADYARHVADYGGLLAPGARVGVGSVCKRRGEAEIAGLLAAIAQVRPDLRLHGFGMKITALAVASVRDRLYSADSMAWSLHARYHGKGPQDWEYAERFRRRIEGMAVQTSFELEP